MLIRAGPRLVPRGLERRTVTGLLTDVTWVPSTCLVRHCPGAKDTA